MSEMSTGCERKHMELSIIQEFESGHEVSASVTLQNRYLMKCLSASTRDWTRTTNWWAEIGLLQTYRTCQLAQIITLRLDDASILRKKHDKITSHRIRHNVWIISSWYWRHLYAKEDYTTFVDNRLDGLIKFQEMFVWPSASWLNLTTWYNPLWNMSEGCLIYHFASSPRWLFGLFWFSSKT